MWLKFRSARSAEGLAQGTYPTTTAIVSSVQGQKGTTCPWWGFRACTHSAIQTSGPGTRRQPRVGEPGFDRVGSLLRPLAWVGEGLRDHDSGEQGPDQSWCPLHSGGTLGTAHCLSEPPVTIYPSSRCHQELILSPC